MIKTIKVDLTIRDNATGAYLRIPVLPETIPYKDGSAIKDTVQILDLGSVNFHNGVELDEFTIESFFPANYDAGYCTTSQLLTTEEYRNAFSGWKDESSSLQIVCPAAFLNKNMELVDFEWYFAGFEMDLYYTATFKERKVILPTKIGVTVGTTGIVTKTATKAGPETRAAISKVAKPETVTVKAGDCLTTIAKKMPPLVTWTMLYEKNKKLIGPNPGLIQVGQKLEVPA